MTDLLVKHLSEKASEHSALIMLVNQWGFDKLLIPKALQSIVSLFPHYSRHDESHSKQILINIERLLGENIKLLTATDTWLLLESAYWHDIGMIVPKADLEDALLNKNFENYLDEIRIDHFHELNKFAINFDPNDLTKCFTGADSPTSAIDKFQQLMAEWFRRHHPERAKKIIQTPWENVGLSSPRTELIPKRLFQMLGRICHLHGANFSEIIRDQSLPFREAGLGKEDCHPRFVACLLRLGDLLDLDNNRFCPVMQRISGDNRPTLSKAHEDKHIAIQHFRLDREKIEVTAECETIGGYLETFKWFDWLKKEVQNQMSNWMSIAPSRELGLLPMLGEISVTLKGEHQVLNPGIRPQFTIDQDSTISLLQGENLYSSKFACIRELLQNAVDSTLIKIWMKDISNDQRALWSEPTSDKVQETLLNPNNTIEFIIKELPSNTSDLKTADWEISIIDPGTGLNLTDLSHMIKIGGSQKNIDRTANIKTMPEWLKPSGNFGIGFQSVFLITDLVKIETKNIYNNETLHIELYSPTSKENGLIVVKSFISKASHFSLYQTKISFVFKAFRFAESWSIKLLRDDQEPSLAAKTLANLDPVLSDEFPFEVAEIFDKAHEFSKISFLPIHIKYESLSGTKEEKIIKNPIEKIGKFISIDGNQSLFNYDIFFKTRHTSSFYRGQEFKASTSLDNCNLSINILSGKASKWLKANRDELKPTAKKDFHALLHSTLLEAIKQDFEEILSNSESKMGRELEELKRIGWRFTLSALCAEG